MDSQGLGVFLEFIAEIGAIDEVEEQGCFERGVSVRIGIGQRIVETVGITVEVLGEVGHLDVVVRAEHARGKRIVKPSVHVDEPCATDVLVAGEPPVEQQTIGIGTVTPCVEMVFLLDMAFAI